MNYLIYRVVPLRCVPPIDEKERQPDLAYAHHGADWLGLGVAAIAYCYGRMEDLLHYEDAFTEGVLVWDEGDTPRRFARLVRSAEVVVGFDAYERSDFLLQANGVGITTHYDLWHELVVVCGKDINLDACNLKGFGSAILSEIAQANGLKNAQVGDLSELWQRGQGDVVKEHVLAQVLTLQKLLVLGMQGNLKIPNIGRPLQLPSLAEVRAQLAC